MLEYEKPSHLANKAMMMRSLYNGCFAIVEGEKDALFYRQYMDNDNCKTIIAKGKDKAIATIKILEQRRFKGAIGIVDSDFTRLDGEKNDNGNVFFTDTHDMETMILKSPALDKFLLQYADESKLNDLMSRHWRVKNITDVREVLLNVAKYPGFLAYLSKKERWDFDLGRIEFEEFMDRGSLYIDPDRMLEYFYNKKNGYNPVSLEEMKYVLNGLVKSAEGKYDLWQVCRGHDMTQILFIGILSNFGKGFVRHTLQTYDDVERNLRLSYEYTHLMSTSLYVSIKEWEKNNPQYKVFKETSRNN
jgi:hypothetical protein